MPTAKIPAAELFLRHALAWASLALAGVIVFAAPQFPHWWWQKLAALPCASIVAAVSIRAAREADRHRLLLSRLERIAMALKPQREPPPGLIPYIDPHRASHRTGQIVYQFIRPPNPISQTGVSLVTTTLEQLIASFLQVGLAKIDTKLSPTTQQLIGTAVPTLVSTIASVIVDLAENHKAAKGAATTK
jgi:hypothetical protein